MFVPTIIYIKRFCQTITAILIAVMVVLVSYVVFERYLLHTAPPWAEELPRVLLVWATFLGGVICTADKSHLTAGITSALIKNPRILHIITYINHLLCIGVLAILVYAGWELTLLTLDDSLPVLGITAGIVYFTLPISCLAMIVIHLLQMVELFNKKHTNKV
ncbi:TRAP transporter small permease [Advenella sp. WQ 585]|uniref:TRAP transporter small permease protein n=1 Tax=Advenella mandrilli TaxID=2800330 RepID=A0ABS1EA70_9BURK|nr:TRAP transporter small permease [Advenella mandrilli]MBK1780396.1 TRAP transporter small permease [Advenella mandrilli]NLY34623.1 TRAP transporter small permease [Alcaligenaceae bacterium]